VCHKGTKLFCQFNNALPVCLEQNGLYPTFDHIKAVIPTSVNTRNCQKRLSIQVPQQTERGARSGHSQPVSCLHCMVTHHVQSDRQAVRCPSLPREARWTEAEALETGQPCLQEDPPDGVGQPSGYDTDRPAAVQHQQRHSHQVVRQDEGNYWLSFCFYFKVLYCYLSICASYKKSLHASVSIFRVTRSSSCSRGSHCKSLQRNHCHHQ